MPNCRSCGTRNIAEFKTVVDSFLNRRVSFSLCPGCGSMQHDTPEFKEESLRLADLYGGLGDHYSMFTMELGQRIFRDMPLIRYTEPGTLLNIECNDGVLALQWMSRGWRVVGTSVSEASRRRARERGIDCTDVPSGIRRKDFDGVMLETSYTHFNNPFSLFDEGVRRLAIGGFFLIHGIDPSSPELLDEDMIGEFVGYNNRTIPSPNRIIGWMRDRGLRLVERYHVGGSFDMLFIKIGRSDC